MTYRRPALTCDERGLVAAQYLDGASVRQLAAHYQCSTAPIIAALIEHGICRRMTNNPQGRPPANRRPNARASSDRRGGR